ncbi:MAG: alpha/beta hydrolase [Novosphingobium sp.]
MNFISAHQFEYIDGQLRPSHPALFDHFEAQNVRAVEEGQPALDLAYGPDPRQTFDLFRTAGRRNAVVAYFHAGYWQSRDKSGFRFLAPPLAADGFDVALINYPLSPQMGVGEIVAAASASLTAISALTDNSPLVLVGHSAGAHIAVELGMKARSTCKVAGILSISGVFDLAPLIHTSVNERLALDAATARAASPLHRVVTGAPPALLAVGENETKAFRDQTADMSAAWAAAGNASRRLTVANADHFSILTELCHEAGTLRTAMRDFIRQDETD